MLRTVRKLFLHIAGDILLIVGIFAAIAGIASGFGDHRIIIKAAYGVGGVVVAIIGFYMNVLAYDGDASKMVDDWIRAWFSSN